MHKKTIVLLACMFIYNLTFACDLCSIYIGLDPNGTKNSFGVRYRYRIFEKDYFSESFNLINTDKTQRVKGQQGTKHGGNNDGHTVNTGEKFTFTETYNSYDVFANFYLNHRLQLNLNTYFADNYTLNNDSIVANVASLGDISVILKYRLFNTKKSGDTLKNKFLHRFTVGGGVNLPTGKFNKSTVTGFETELKPNVILGAPIEELDPHLQAGTGSFSYLFLVEYLVKFNKLGFNGNVSYKHNTTNKNGFRFANRFNANGTTFFLATLSKKVKIMPTSGLSFETSRRDLQNDEHFLGSGGNVLFFNGGINLFINKISIEFSYYTPIYEDLLDDQAFNKNRMITQLAYYF